MASPRRTCAARCSSPTPRSRPAAWSRATERCWSQTGTYLESAEDVRTLVVGVQDRKPVFLRDVAEVVDGPDQAAQYVWFGTGAAAEQRGIGQQGLFPAVTLALSKKPGANAADVPQAAMQRLENLRGSVIPEGVEVTVTRDYGNTANDKAKDRAATAEDIQQAAKYALLAYQLAFSAPSDSEEAWLPYQWISFRLYDGLVQKGAKNVMQMVAYNQALTDFPPKDGVKFTVPIECGTTKDKFDVYIWEWTRKYPQTDSQADWVRQVRGCTIPQETVESFRRVYSVASENKVSFPELAKYAFDPKNEVAVKQSSPPAQTKESLAAQSSARNQSDTNITPDETLGLAAVAVGAFACWYWRDQCKELAWEAAKVGARDAWQEGSPISPRNVVQHIGAGHLHGTESILNR